MSFLWRKPMKLGISPPRFSLIGEISNTLNTLNWLFCDHIEVFCPKEYIFIIVPTFRGNCELFFEEKPWNLAFYPQILLHRGDLRPPECFSLTFLRWYRSLMFNEHIFIIAVIIQNIMGFFIRKNMRFGILAPDFAQ